MNTYLDQFYHFILSTYREGMFAPDWKAPSGDSSYHVNELFCRKTYIYLCMIESLSQMSYFFLAVTIFANKVCLHWQQNIEKRNTTYRSQQFFLSNCQCHSKGVRSSRLNALIKPHIPKLVIYSDTASSVKWIQISCTLWWIVSNLISLQRSQWNEAE